MTDARDIENLKHEARARARAARSSIDAEARATCYGSLCGRLLEVPELDRANVMVLAYAALSEEIDPAAALEELTARGATIAYPRVEGEGALGIHVANLADLQTGAYGVREPRETEPRVEPGRVDVALVPGVAFDQAGYRLGYGGGYYDRLLPLLCDDALVIGLAFDEQVVDELPVEEHDIRVDMVVTPERTIRIPGTR